MASAWRPAGLWRLRRDRRGAMALEFAITGVAFLAATLFVIALGFRIYVQVALDYAASRAARLLAVNATQTLSANAQNFQSVTFCPLLSAFIACSGLKLSLQPVSNYANDSPIGTGTPPFTPGQDNSLMLLQAQYQMPVLSWLLPGTTPGTATTGNFASAYVTTNYPYVNEY